MPSNRHQLEIEYADLAEELCDAYDELGFLRGQELMKKKEVWNADPAASIQARDRSASYAAAEITAEIYKAEARTYILKQRLRLCERLLDADER